MIVLTFAVFGALLGALMARRQGGNRLDIAHYVGVYLLVFVVIGVLVSIVLARTAAG